MGTDWHMDTHKSASSLQVHLTILFALFLSVNGTPALFSRREDAAAAVLNKTSGKNQEKRETAAADEARHQQQQQQETMREGSEEESETFHRLSSSFKSSSNHSLPSSSSFTFPVNAVVFAQLNSREAHRRKRAMIGPRRGWES
jgi:hypothetical protein